jgi:hypothetical protein
LKKDFRAWTQDLEECWMMSLTRENLTSGAKATIFCWVYVRAEARTLHLLL